MLVLCSYIHNSCYYLTSKFGCEHLNCRLNHSNIYKCQLRLLLWMGLKKKRHKGNTELLLVLHDQTDIESFAMHIKQVLYLVITLQIKYCSVYSQACIIATACSSFEAEVQTHSRGIGKILTAICVDQHSNIVILINEINPCPAGRLDFLFLHLSAVCLLLLNRKKTASSWNAYQGRKLMNA